MVSSHALGAVAALGFAAQAQVTNPLPPPLCKTQTEPNPIFKQNPGNPSGVLNGTLAILPISYELARRLVPKQYPILCAAIKELLPSWPDGMYPALLESEIDHDIRFGGIPAIPDFLRAGISFPFVDRLNDGYTSMSYGVPILISASNLVGIAGATTYGNDVTPASFDPPCDAYRADGPGTAFDAFSATAVNGSKQGISGKFVKASGSPFSLDFWKNVTGQPQFSNGSTCDNFIRYFNTSLSADLVDVKGTVRSTKRFFGEQDMVFQDVWGLQGAQAFVEINYQDCKSLQGDSH